MSNEERYIKGQEPRSEKCEDCGMNHIKENITECGRLPKRELTNKEIKLLYNDSKPLVEICGNCGFIENLHGKMIGHNYKVCKEFKPSKEENKK